MPATTVTDTEQPSDSELDAADAIREQVRKYITDVRELRAVPARKADQRARPLAEKVPVVIDRQEDLDALSEDCTRRILDIIRTAANGETWRGEVHLLGDNGANHRRVVIKAVPVLIEGDTPSTSKPTTRESETVAVLKACADTMKSQQTTIDGLGKALVTTANALSDEKNAHAKMFKRMTKVAGRVLRGDRKWKYKMRKESEKTDRQREKSRERAAATHARWDAFEVATTEYKDVIEIWSRYFTRGRKPGDPTRPPPTRPTVDELKKIFDPTEEITVDGRPFREVFDPIRAIISEMISESDVKRRIEIAKEQLVPTIKKLSNTAKDAMKLRILQQLGMDRAEEVSAWLSLPVT